MGNSMPGAGMEEPLESDGEIEEGVSAKIAKVEELPSKEEVEAHNASHVPYRSWCPHCANGATQGGRAPEARQS